MSLSKMLIAVWFFISATVMALSACTTAPVEEETAISTSNHLIRHTLHEVAEYDTLKMLSVLNREFAPDAKNDELYFNQAAIVLGQTVLVQPHFTEREASIREFKSKFEQSEFLDLLPKTADQLISIAASTNPADQASALYALTNLVIEVRSVYNVEKEFRQDLHALLARLRDAHLKVSDRAKRYAHEQITDLVSPSDEADAALKILDAAKS